MYIRTALVLGCWLLAAGLPCRAGDGAAPGGQAQAADFNARQSQRIKRHWGVDIEGVRTVSSGYMLAFRYRVLDAERARSLNDKAARPYLIDEATGIRMAVPAMEKVGELRQSVDPEAGRSYFIVFGNPGRTVKPGNRVSVVIGGLQVDGIVVK
jgi:hypothetical protein